MAISTFKRYEKKYLISRDLLQELLPVFLEHMELDEYCIGGKEYRIFSIYYDTVNHDVIRANSQGAAYKEKMRIRSYYADNDPESTVFMELKKKCRGVGNKRRIVIKQREIAPFVEEGILPECGDYLSKQVAKELAYFLKLNRVRPVLYVQYDRLALFGKEDRNFRITFDRNVRTRRKDFRFGEREDDELLLPEDMYIMEIKILGAVPLWLTRILSENGLFSRGFSKYGVRYRRDAQAHKLCYYLTDKDGKHTGFDYFINL